ncbi:MAG TPA: acyloxyacyl hydrolase [Stellaceae bacterium]|nr:acyloxyacyl hydrolase [Stellaceae bacterium]
MPRVRDAVAAAMVAAALGMPSLALADDPPLVAVGAGDIDFDHKEPAAELRAEYRFQQGFFFIKPTVGAFGTSRRSVYVYGGLRADLIFFDHYVLMPNAAVGYFDRGNGKDLGSHIEFKTGAEFAWRFDNAARLGLAFDHISNAGITKRNPGTEQLLLMLSWPLNW